MTGKRNITVHVLIVFAFIVLMLIPMLGFTAASVTADETAQTAVSHSGDYVFFIVEQSDVPLAAAPMTSTPSYVFWICLSCALLMIMFVYTGWYLTVRRNIAELTARLLPSERKAYQVTQGFLHPVKCYQLAREAEDQVSSIYNKYF